MASLDSGRLESSELDDETRERWRTELESAGDVDLVMHLLTVHKLVEHQATGKARYLAQAEATAITTVLGRFAPITFGDALAVYEEEAEPIDEVLSRLARARAASEGSDS